MWRGGCIIRARFLGDIKKVFDKFERITAEKIEGTGLGLPITKDIIELHNGRIWVESEVGKGATFKLSFPAAP